MSNMLRGLTKDLTVITTNLRSLPVIETGWDKFPYYYEATGQFSFVDYYGMPRTIYAGDYIVWDNNDRFMAKRKNVWSKLYGDFLMKKENENEKLLEK